jgi:putrescine transport system ATP-binding protein
MNLFSGRVIDAQADVLRIESELGELRFERAGLGAHKSGAAEVGVAVRPERIRLTDAPPPEGLIGVQGRVAQLAYLGDASLVYVDTAAGRRITCRLPNQRRGADMPVAVGETCWVAWEAADCLLLMS